MAATALLICFISLFCWLMVDRLLARLLAVILLPFLPVKRLFCSTILCHSSAINCAFFRQLKSHARRGLWFTCIGAFIDKSNMAFTCSLVIWFVNSLISFIRFASCSKWVSVRE